MNDHEKSIFSTLSTSIALITLKPKPTSAEAMKLELIEWLAKLQDPGLLNSLLSWKRQAKRRIGTPTYLRSIKPP